VTARTRGALTAVLGACLIPAFATYDPTDPSWNASSAEPASNLLGGSGAVGGRSGAAVARVGAWIAALLMLALGLHRAFDPRPSEARRVLRRRAMMGVLGLMLLSAVLAAPAPPALWPLAEGLGGLLGERLLTGTTELITLTGAPHARPAAAALFGLLALPLLAAAVGLTWRDLMPSFGARSPGRSKPAAARDAAPVEALPEPVKRARAAAKRLRAAPRSRLTRTTTATCRRSPRMRPRPASWTSPCPRPRGPRPSVRPSRRTRRRAPSCCPTSTC
jgi:S-DNA-T family DNA segregation ATPase FtsK/SpoIIIE